MIRSRRTTQSLLQSLLLPVLLCVVALAAASPARAQAPRATPDRHLVGYGFDVGVLFPDESFENTLTVDGYGEFYLTPRVSVRGMLAWASPGVDGRTEDKYRQVKLLFGGNYNWAYKAWRPFAGGGAGAYFVRLKLDGREDPEGESRGGIYFGGGTDYIIDDESAIKVEFRWDVISDPPGLPDASGPSLTFGYKRFF
jgi:hypothetical protein